MNYRMGYRECRAIRARRRNQRVAAILIAAAVLAVSAILLAASVKPASGATDAPGRRVVCVKYKVMHDGNHSQIRLCSRWGIR